MRAAPAVRTAANLAWRNVLLAVVVVLTAMVGLALLTEAMSNGDRGTVYLANFSSRSQIGPNGPSILVTGTGRATAAAERASIQLMLTRRDGGYAGPAVIRPDATPEPDDQVRATVSPVLDALSDNGVDADDVEVVTSPAFGIFNCFGPECPPPIRLSFSVADPTGAGINTLINSAQAGAAGIGLSIERVGVSYAIADCQPLMRRAREAAVTDARERAEQQAAVLGVDLGDLLLSSEPAQAQSGDTNACGMPAPSTGLDDTGRATAGITLPPFEPGAPAEALAVVQVSLAYAIPADDQDA